MPSPPIEPAAQGIPGGRWARLARYGTSGRLSVLLIKLLAIYSIIVVALVAIIILVFAKDVRQQAIIKEMLGALLLWVVVGGPLNLRFREGIRALILRIRLGWRLKFALFCILLALLEEAITTSMTNLAPLYGATPEEAHITASTNYVYVVLFHSVIVFIPMFIGWAYLLGGYDFYPNAVFLMYGLTGSTAEAFLNPTGLISGFWFFVYGLMVYLPAFSLPKDRGAREPKWIHHVLGVLVPMACAIPVAPVVVLVRTWLRIPLFPGT
jgi:hypothetical protein